MVNESRFQTVIQDIRNDPQKFIYGQFAPGGVFENCPVTRGDLDCIPIIMRLVVHERIFLTITVWKSDEFGYSMESYLAYNSWEKPETWECTSTSPPIYIDVDDQPEFMPAYAMEDAGWAWRHYKTNTPARNHLPEHAWFFPGGLAEALDGTTWLDYASNAPSETKEK
jgi:hypothetical protein